MDKLEKAAMVEAEKADQEKQDKLKAFEEKAKKAGKYVRNVFHLRMLFCLTLLCT